MLHDHWPLYFPLLVWIIPTLDSFNFDGCLLAQIVDLYDLGVDHSVARRIFPTAAWDRNEVFVFY